MTRRIPAYHRFLCYAQDMAAPGQTVVVPKPLRFKGNRLKDVPDGKLCTLFCGCLVRKMMILPHRETVVAAWMRRPCAYFDAELVGQRFHCAGGAAVRRALKGELQVELPTSTPATYDPLVAELEESFGD